MADFYTSENPADDLFEFAAAEISAGLTLTRRTADREMGLAMDLAHRHPELLGALEKGMIGVAKVRVIINGVGHVDGETATAAIERILPEAPDLTTGQIASRLRKIVIEADPEEAKKSYKDGVDARQVWSELASDGTGTMLATGLEGHEMSAANRNINGIAWRIKNSGDPRTIDQLRADAFISLLTGSMSSTAERAHVDIHADLTTLAELDDNPGELAGFGPVIADIARQVARQQEDATWTFTVTDPETGETFVGTTSRRPSTELRRKLRARYSTCVFMGCRMPSVICDLDHTKDWVEGGLTTLCNLAPLCRYHHRLKHLTAWTYRKLDNGAIHWVSQLGLTYTTHPP